MLDGGWQLAHSFFRAAPYIQLCYYYAVCAVVLWGVRSWYWSIAKQLATFCFRIRLVTTTTTQYYYRYHPTSKQRTAPSS